MYTVQNFIGRFYGCVQFCLLSIADCLNHVLCSLVLCSCVRSQKVCRERFIFANHELDAMQCKEYCEPALRLHAHVHTRHCSAYILLSGLDKVRSSAGRPSEEYCMCCMQSMLHTGYVLVGTWVKHIHSISLD